MALTADRPRRPRPAPRRHPATPARPRRPTRGRPTGILAWVTGTDHRTIGLSYMVTALPCSSWQASGVMALIIRAELFEPGQQIVNTDSWQAVHDAAASCLFSSWGRSRSGWRTTSMPLQIGARDMAFPG